MAINHEMNYYNYGKTLSAEGIMPVLPQNGKQWPEHEYVDLGLPSGTLWATDDIKNESGNTIYFRWGETQGYTDEQLEQELPDYKFFIYKDGYEYPEMTKYGYVDGKFLLDPKDDAATANWGPDWCMPTYAQILELLMSGSYRSGNTFSVSGENGTTLNFETPNGDGDWFSSCLNIDNNAISAYGFNTANSGTTIDFNTVAYRNRPSRIRPVRKKR